MFAVTLILAVASLALVKVYHLAVLAPEADRAATAETAARAAIAAGRTALPSWVDDETRTEGFAQALVAHLLRAGVAQSRIEAALTDVDFKTGVISLAAHLEAAGAPYPEQLAGAAAFALRLIAPEAGPEGAAGSPRNRAPAPPRSAATPSDAKA